jgi:hypothetical protein
MGQVRTHAPDVHAAKPAVSGVHAIPHPPQCARVVCVLVSQPSAALLLQLPKPALQVPTPQVPAAQVCVATLARAHTRLHIPQWETLVWVSTHAPLQSVCVQVDAQTPLAQTCPEGQALLQAPQCALLVCVLVSQPLAAIPSQLPKPVVQVPTPQVPAAQVCVVTLARAHARPHIPQCATAVWVLVSQPLAAIASQLPKFIAQAPTPQAPAAQVCVATLARAHARSQPPQWETFVWVSTHAPLHSVCAQVDAHAPFTHICPEGHARLQAPQCALLVCVLTSQPLTALPSQFAKPRLHAPTPQAPAAQVCIATAGRLHIIRQAPQFAGSTWVLTSQPSTALPLQLAKPVLQVIPQVPDAQVALALARAGQALLQAPQCDVLVCGSTQSGPQVVIAQVAAQAPLVQL